MNIQPAQIEALRSAVEDDRPDDGQPDTQRRYRRDVTFHFRTHTTARRQASPKTLHDLTKDDTGVRITSRHVTVHYGPKGEHRQDIGFVAQDSNGWYATRPLPATQRTRSVRGGTMREAAENLLFDLVNDSTSR